MWIRSQDKKQLVNANDLYIAVRGKGYAISTGKGNDLGTYSSEAKAIMVLDDIQLQLQVLKECKVCENVIILNNYTYTMPNEDDLPNVVVCKKNKVE